MLGIEITCPTNVRFLMENLKIKMINGSLRLFDIFEIMVWKTTEGTEVHRGGKREK
jgi:hypothetical protein